MKNCVTCKIEKPLEDFSINRKRKDGRNGVCKKCKSEYNKKYYKNNPEKKAKHFSQVKDIKAKYLKWLQSYKLKRGCNECGFNKHSAALHIHHLKPEIKTVEPSRMHTKGWSPERMKLELEHCEVLCANCHAIKHHTPV